MEKLEKARLINTSDITTSSAISPSDQKKYVESKAQSPKEYPARWLALIGFGLGSAIVFIKTFLKG